jgi:hypothetical protein
VVVVRQLRDKEREGLEVPRTLELAAVGWLKTEVANEPRHRALRAVIISAVAHGRLFGQGIRTGANQLRRHSIERFHYACTAGATGDNLAPGGSESHDEGGVGCVHWVRAIDENLAAQISGEPQHSIELLPMHGEDDYLGAPGDFAWGIGERLRAARARRASFAGSREKLNPTVCPLAENERPSAAPMLPDPRMPMRIVPSLLEDRLEPVYDSGDGERVPWRGTGMSRQLFSSCPHTTRCRRGRISTSL